uniref:Uncharacterized protein n=1 Tax=Globodera rostochiensis TaxID=31243 RepID=A0A914IBH7_GLORO
MFNFFSILLLAIAVLQIVEGIQIWVKPSNLRYEAEISCLHRNLPIKIGTAKHDSIFEAAAAAGYVDIGKDLSRCDDSTVKVRITNLNRLNESMEQMLKTEEVLARKSAVVLGFNIASPAHKIFNFKQSSSSFRFIQQSSLGVFQRRLVNYELEIGGIQFNGQNGINIPIYETGMMEDCKGRIVLDIYNAGRESTYIDVTREFLLQNDAFNIDIVNETVRPIPQNVAVLQFVEAIEIWVKPSVLRYKAEISCLQRKRSITIGTATHSRIFGESVTADNPGGHSVGYVKISTVIGISKCDHDNPKVKILITNLDHPSKSIKFEMSKAELSARKSAVVLGFNIAPLAHKQFYFQQSSSNFGVSQPPLMDYELELVCYYRHADGNDQYYLIGSGVQKHGKNGINIPIYEIEMLAFCNLGRIGLDVHNAEREKTFINVTKEFLLENDAFNINMSNKTIQPISQRRTIGFFDGSIKGKWSWKLNRSKK